VTARISTKGKQLLDEIAKIAFPMEKRFGRLAQDQLRTLIAALDVIREG
jgi:hypothetical protein